jgi:methyltransferase family protein
MSNKYAYNIEVDHTTFIIEVVKLTGCELYLELGIEWGENMREISKYCDKCIGVDIKDIRRFEDFDFRLEKTDDFFEKFNEKPNIIFIDADHHFEQVKKDFINSINCLSEHGIIFLHDTDPFKKELTREQFCGDTYKIHDWIKAEYPELNIITLPISVAGLTMVNRESERRLLKYNK